MMFDFTLCCTHSTNGRAILAAKTVSPNPKQCRPYDNCLLWKLTEHSLTFDQMVAALDELAQLRAMMIIRAALAPGISHGSIAPRWIAKSHGTNVTLVARPRAWIALDFDGAPVPTGLGAGDRIGDAAEYIVANYLPQEFRLARGIAVATASSGSPKCLGTGADGYDLARQRQFYETG